VTRSLVPVDPVGLSLPRCCSSSFVLASALLPSLSSFVPKVSREVCVCFHLFVCDPRSCDWDIGRVLLRKNYCQLPFTPLPLFGRQSDPSEFPTSVGIPKYFSLSASL
jgi:hypothetical protein